MRQRSTRSGAQERPLPGYKHWHLLLVFLLAIQYPLLQLVTGDEYGDAARNLHWGMYILEQPDFLFGADDVYDRILGFPPSDPSLVGTDSAPKGASVTGYRWWGPLYLSFLAGLWRLTGSYTVLRLFLPVVGGAAVLLIYAFGLRYFNRRVALTAALLLALFPIYRRQAALAFVEPLSMVLLGSSFWAFLAQRSILAGIFGSLAVLGKIDMIPLYLGTLLATVLLCGRDCTGRFSLRHVLISLALPLLALLPWLYLAYVVHGRPLTAGEVDPMGALENVKDTLRDFFHLHWSATLVVFAFLGAATWVGVRHREERDPIVDRLLLCWLAIGSLVFLVYTVTPGAGPRARVFIPSLPPLCLLTAAGLQHMSARLRWTALLGLLLFFVAVNVRYIVGVQLPRATTLRSMRPVWQILRDEPRGYVMTAAYWQAMLYARQPATWFAFDQTFQDNILHDATHLREYLENNPIRYIVLPRENRGTTSPEASAYLQATYPKRVVGAFVIFTLPER